MAKFGPTSVKKLKTCHPDIQKVLNEAIKHYDFTVLFGYRTPEEQFELFKQGRKFNGSAWVKVGPTVTNLDGKTKLSEHNHSPSLAVDIAPFPIIWNDISRFKELSKVIKEAATKVGVDIEWGGDWKTFVDYPHYQIKGN